MPGRPRSPSASPAAPARQRQSPANGAGAASTMAAGFPLTQTAAKGLPQSEVEPQVRTFHRRIASVLAILAGLLVVAVILGSSIGPVPVPFDKTVAIVLQRLGFDTGVAFSAREALVVDQVRLPRVLTAVLVGAALGTAGTIMQGVFRNPLADPGVIGVSSGAAVGAVTCIALGWSAAHRWMLPAFAFAGAMASIALVFGIWASGRLRSVSTLLLIGIGINSLLSAVISAIMTLAKNEQELRGIVFWLQGGLDARTWEHVSLIALPIVLGIALALVYGRDMNMLLLGEEHAKSAGVHVGRTRLVLLLLASLITGTGVAVTGVIGFVGLIVPHLLRLIAGPDHRLLLPASALGGALFLVLADLVSRVAFQPHNLQVGVVTAFVGAPLFLFMALRSSRAGVH